MSFAVLCADIGTSSLKAAVITDCGVILRSTTERFNKKQGSNCWLEAFSQACSYLIKKILYNREELPEIKAICISGNGPSIVNSGGSFLWNEPYVPGEAAEDIVKLQPGFSIFIPRILHVKHYKPEMWNINELLYSIPEYVVYQLTETSQTILPDPRYENAYWTQDDLRIFGIPETKLPPLTKLGTSAGKIKPEMAAKIGLPDGMAPEVFCGGPDFTIALIGTNTLSEGKICDRAGTSEGINLCTKKPLKSDALRTLPSPVYPLWNASVLIPDSGYRFSTWKHENLYADIPNEECTRYILEHPECSGYGLLIKIAFEVRNAYKVLFKAASEEKISLPSVIYSTGGQARNRLWMQMKSDIIGLPFVVTACPDSELTGNLVVALYGLGEYKSIQEAADAVIIDDITYYPDKKRQTAYAEAYKELFIQE